MQAKAKEVLYMEQAAKKAKMGSDLTQGPIMKGQMCIRDRNQVYPCQWDFPALQIKGGIGSYNRDIRKMVAYLCG